MHRSYFCIHFWVAHTNQALICHDRYLNHALEFSERVKFKQTAVWLYRTINEQLKKFWECIQKGDEDKQLVYARIYTQKIRIETFLLVTADTQLIKSCERYHLYWRDLFFGRKSILCGSFEWKPIKSGAVSNDQSTTSRAGKFILFNSIWRKVFLSLFLSPYSLLK